MAALLKKIGPSAPMAQEPSIYPWVEASPLRRRWLRKWRLARRATRIGTGSCVTGPMRTHSQPSFATGMAQHVWRSRWLLLEAAEEACRTPAREPRDVSVSTRQLQEVRSLQLSALDNGRWGILRKLRVR